MTYTREIQIEFNHCDPAGIVFYPRYFEMVNSVVENFFAAGLGYGFARMVAEGVGVPTVRILAEFRAPSRLGDSLEFSLNINRIGTTSVNLLLIGACKGELRMTADLTLVWLSVTGCAAPWPEVIRARMAAFVMVTP